MFLILFLSIGLISSYSQTSLSIQNLLGKFQDKIKFLNTWTSKHGVYMANLCSNDGIDKLEIKPLGNSFKYITSYHTMFFIPSIHRNINFTLIAHTYILNLVPIMVATRFWGWTLKHCCRCSSLVEFSIPSITNSPLYFHDPLYYSFRLSGIEIIQNVAMVEITIEVYQYALLM